MMSTRGEINIVHTFMEMRRRTLCGNLELLLTMMLSTSSLKKVWENGSLEEWVQHMVKTWEMEMFHKIRPQDYKTLKPDIYTFSLNGRPGINLEEKRKLGGGYNVLLQTSLPEELRCYNPKDETAESSHTAFTTAFPRGFAVEILQVYSGPPTVVYKFRHWGYMEGPFKGHPPTGKKVELHGIGIFQVDDEKKIEKVEFFYDRGELLGGLVGVELVENSEKTSSSSTCPFMINKNM